MWSKIIFILLIFPALIIPSCKLANDTQIPDTRLKVTATIFPLYDFARAVGGEKISVSMLLPPGADAHNYELKPEEIVKVTNSDVFLFINFEMEQWAYKIISAATEKTNMLAVETGKGTFLLPLAVAGEQEQDEYGGQHASRFDPHIWLDLANAQTIIDNITRRLSIKTRQTAITTKQRPQIQITPGRAG